MSQISDKTLNRAHSDFWFNSIKDPWSYEEARIASKAIADKFQLSRYDISKRVNDYLGEDAISSTQVKDFIDHDCPRDKAPRRPLKTKAICITAIVQIIFDLARSNMEAENLRDIFLRIGDDDEHPVDRIIKACEAIETDSRYNNLDVIHRRLDDYPASGKLRLGTMRVSNIKKTLARIPYRDEYSAKSTRSKNHPIFPLRNPRYPATPCFRIGTISDHVVYLKDESANPTGSHKDRWALEKILEYARIISEYLEKSNFVDSQVVPLPELSLISAGSAAYALQRLLKFFDLPPLRVLIDETQKDDAYVKLLRSIHAKVYFTDLNHHLLSEKDVMRLTQNSSAIVTKIPPDSLDVTTRDVFESDENRYYDFLVSEILEYKPDHILVPFGTGGLFTNLIRMVAKIKEEGRVDSFTGQDLRSKDIGIYGFTSLDSGGPFKKLYAKHRPGYEKICDYVEKVVEEGHLRAKSGIFEVHRNEHLIDAMNSASQIRDQDQIVWKIGIEPSGVAAWAGYYQYKDEIGIQPNERVVLINTGALNTMTFT